MQQPVALELRPTISRDDFPACQDISNFVELGGPNDANVDVDPNEVAAEQRQEAERYKEMLRNIKRFPNPFTWDVYLGVG